MCIYVYVYMVPCLVFTAPLPPIWHGGLPPPTHPPPVTYFRERVYTMHDSLHTCDMLTLTHIYHCATPWLKTCSHSRKIECSVPPR